MGENIQGEQREKENRKIRYFENYEKNKNKNKIIKIY